MFFLLLRVQDFKVFITARKSPNNYQSDFHWLYWCKCHMFLQFVYKPEILTSTNNSTKNQRTNKHTKKQRFVGGLQFTTNMKHIAYVNFFQVTWALKSGDCMCMNVHIGFKGSLSHLRGVFLENSNFLILWHCLMLFFFKKVRLIIVQSCYVSLNILTSFPLLLSISFLMAWICRKDFLDVTLNTSRNPCARKSHW